jgi:hypothetical protein
MTKKKQVRKLLKIRQGAKFVAAYPGGKYKDAVPRGRPDGAPRVSLNLGSAKPADGCYKTFLHRSQSTVPQPVRLCSFKNIASVVAGSIVQQGREMICNFGSTFFGGEFSFSMQRVSSVLRAGKLAGLRPICLTR